VLALTLLLLAAQAPPAPQARPTPPSQLTVDHAFAPPVDAPDFPSGQRPVVLVDEAHRNVVSLQTYLAPVARWLERAGYIVRPARVAAVDHAEYADRLPPPGTPSTRSILVIANAQAPEGAAPGAPAFGAEEIGAIQSWVDEGGGLLLVADRAPFGAPARALAKAFGVTLDDNTILMKGADGQPTGELTVDINKDGARRHPLFDRVLRIVYVVGESIDGPGVVLRAPEATYSGPTAQATDGPPAAGRPIVLAFEHGKGRVVVIGDAGVVSAFGSAGGAAHRGISEGDNARFVRNVFKWLATRDQGPRTRD
jgi:hypothetical protein